VKERIESLDKKMIPVVQDLFNQDLQENNKPLRPLTFDDTLMPIGHKYTSPPKKRTCKEKEYSIYSIDNLPELLIEMGKYNSIKNKIRYIVDREFNVRFGLEGTPSSKIPAHYQLASENPNSAECIIAGNFELDDKKYLKMVNNKSGDFRPNFDQLKWVLALLFYHQQKLPTDFLSENITIEKQGATGKCMEKYVTNTEILKVLLTPFIEYIEKIAEKKNRIIALEPGSSQKKMSNSSNSSAFFSLTSTNEKKRSLDTKKPFFSETNNKAFQSTTLSAIQENDYDDNSGKRRKSDLIDDSLRLVTSRKLFTS
jgi:hypothetical protein